MKKLIVFLLSLTAMLSLVGCGSKTDIISETHNILTTEKPATTEPTETTEEHTVESNILSFVDSFNSNSSVSLVFADNFIPSDKSSSHYRTEFRLGAYSDAIGKSYTYGEAVVDLVGKQDWSGDISIRVYMDRASLDQCIEMLKFASPIMDSDIDCAELQEAIDYVIENKTANGYYYADLGLLLLGSDIEGYDFMLKMGND